MDTEQNFNLIDFKNLNAEFLELNKYKLIDSEDFHNLGFVDNTVWAQCDGSGSKPYNITLQHGNHIVEKYNCTCPSRVLPCKHVKSLLTNLKDKKLTLVSANSKPDFIKVFKETSVTKTIEVLNEDQQAEARLKYQKDLAKKIEELKPTIKLIKTKLEDKLTQGLAQIKIEANQGDLGSGFFTEIVKELHDAKLPALSEYFAGFIEYQTNDVELWSEWFLQRLFKFLLVDKMIDVYEDLELSEQFDLVTFLGIAIKKTDIIKLGLGVKYSKDKGFWQVICTRKVTGLITKKLTTNYTIIQNQADPSLIGLILGYVYSATADKGEVKLKINDCFEADVYYYPSTTPQRCFLENVIIDTNVKLTVVPALYANFEELIEKQTQQISQNPFENVFIFSLEDPRLSILDRSKDELLTLGLSLVDKDNKALKIDYENGGFVNKKEQKDINQYRNTIINRFANAETKSTIANGMIINNQVYGLFITENPEN
jgi:hypothetical protein